MKLKLILAVERANLTEQDEVRLLDMDCIEYGTEKLFKSDLSQALADRTGKGKGNHRNICRMGKIRTGKRGF